MPPTRPAPLPYSNTCRFGAATLVCKRLRELCLSPQLLGSVAFYVGQPVTAVPRLRALLHFLLAHGRQVRELDVYQPPLNGLPAEQQLQEAAVWLGACLAACSGPGSSLSRLVLSDVPQPSLGLPPGLTALRELQLGRSKRPLRLPPGLQQLSCLTELHLVGRPIVLEHGAQLPASLLQLCLADRRSEQLPRQVGRGSVWPFSLQRLRLWFAHNRVYLGSATH